MTESAVSFKCRGDSLVGILHRPDQPQQRGVLFVVGGGPQYRSGGHRQLTLWSRRLCSEGFPVFRFDYRGMGDSKGQFVGFEGIHDDIEAAIDQFFETVPELKEVVLWGECDASSAILFYAHRDTRAKGIVLLNPWVRTQAGEAKTILRFYYLQRIMQPSFWRKVFSFRFNPFASVLSVLKLMRQSRTSKADSAQISNHGIGEVIQRHGSLPERLLLGLTRFQGPVMLVLSGRDLIAREFDDLMNGSDAWQDELRRKPATRHDLPESDHTFSSAAQRDQVVGWGVDWLRSW
ncbi:hydrolase 1, exosortase A system-associated [Polaromonas sp. UC242_47]|uniref:hydrolase 1, exosortase A system-associated n=1 Tax=Polaromonas sp. UC242_47 TaxID=3374626 RepID=UPI00379A1685